MTIRSMLKKAYGVLGSDGTRIGNIIDRLKVESWMRMSKYLTYNDMNVSTGGIARGTTVVANSVWVKLYEYTGSGALTGLDLRITTANSGWFIRIVMDSSQEVFTSSGISTTDIDTIYTLDINSDQRPAIGLGVGVKGNQFYFSAPSNQPISFSTKIEVYVLRPTGAGNKVFNGGLIVHSKES